MPSGKAWPMADTFAKPFVRNFCPKPKRKKTKVSLLVDVFTGGRQQESQRVMSLGLDKF